jgi:hypothetical protein
MTAKPSAIPSIARGSSRARLLPRVAALLLALSAPGVACAQSQGLVVTPIGSGNVTPQSMAQSLLAGAPASTS